MVAADVVLSDDPDVLLSSGPWNVVGDMGVNGLDEFTLYSGASALTFSGLAGGTPGGSIQLGVAADGQINALTVSEVPVPAALWLFASALAGLGWMRRKRTA